MVVTGKGEKRSDFGYVSNPVWAGIADELDVRVKENSRVTSKIFWHKQLEVWNCC
jgi:hypothetical protein